ncbi:MAG: ribosome biogenesis GTPase Der [Patescibacteria group bacterium]|jgi:GTP-binding protein
MDKLPKIALIGRANVGKSTLFNRLTEQKKAIISTVAGTTRDRNYGLVSWRGLNFTLIDTGGLDIVHEKHFTEDVIKQSKFALAEADLVLFMLSAKDGLMPQDNEVAKILRKSKKPVLVVINKADNPATRKNLADYYRLGLGVPQPVSATNGSGTGDLLDVIQTKLNKKAKAPMLDEKIIKIAIIGKPNVGKSSLLNAITDSERVIVSPIPYTTRDPQDMEFTYQGNNYLLIDTAGIRKKSHINDRLEKYSVDKAVDTIHRADVVLLVTEVDKPLGKQDQHLSEIILDAKKSLIIIANKWDTVDDKNVATINKFTDYYRRFFPYLAYAPILFTSAKESQRVKKILELTKEIYQERSREITENALDKFLKNIIKKHAPSRGKGTNHPRILGLKQTRINPPEFEIIKDFASDIHFSYFRFMENQLREKFGFLGTPVILRVRRIKL